MPEEILKFPILFTDPPYGSEVTGLGILNQRWKEERYHQMASQKVVPPPPKCALERVSSSDDLLRETEEKGILPTPYQWSALRRITANSDPF